MGYTGQKCRRVWGQRAHTSVCVCVCNVCAICVQDTGSIYAYVYTQVCTHDIHEACGDVYGGVCECDCVGSVWWGSVCSVCECVNVYVCVVGICICVGCVWWGCMCMCDVEGFV